MRKETEALPLWKTLLLVLFFLICFGAIYYFFGSAGVLMSIFVLLGVSHIFNR